MEFLSYVEIENLVDPAFSDLEYELVAAVAAGQAVSAVAACKDIVAVVAEQLVLAKAADRSSVGQPVPVENVVAVSRSLARVDGDGDGHWC